MNEKKKRKEKKGIIQKKQTLRTKSEKEPNNHIF